MTTDSSPLRDSSPSPIEEVVLAPPAPAEGAVPAAVTTPAAPPTPTPVSVVQATTPSRSYPFQPRWANPGEIVAIEHKFPVPARIVEIQAVGIMPPTGESRAVEVVAIMLASGERIEQEGWVGMDLAAPFAIVLKNVSGVRVEVRGTVFAQPLDGEAILERTNGKPELLESPEEKKAPVGFPFSGMQGAPFLSPTPAAPQLPPASKAEVVLRPAPGEVGILMKRSEAELLAAAVKHTAASAPHILHPFAESGILRTIIDAIARCDQASQASR